MDEFEELVKLGKRFKVEELKIQSFLVEEGNGLNEGFLNEEGFLINVGVLIEDGFLDVWSFLLKQGFLCEEEE